MNNTLIRKQELSLSEILTTAYNDYGRVLSTFAFNKLSNREVCKDLVQQTFMKAWLYLKRGGEIVTMKAFLYRILNNLIVDEYRKHKTTSLETLLEKGFEPASDDPKRLLSVLDTEAVYASIAHLPETCKKVVRMKYIEDLSLEEISHITGKSKNAISVQLHRGIEKLRIVYKERPFASVSSAGIEPATTP